ncbi:type 1 glutamine amidotransferase [Pantanalinema rosaneae CENA516]|uniref:type 1 glutamine amidotransferase n=1 Tax=Pantanalinema rosaneae TaxID=1620701 RepID=UPI003D6FD19D
MVLQLTSGDRSLMASHRSQLRILLMQIRDDEVTRLEEFDEFVRYSDLEPEQFTVLNVFKTPNFAPDWIHGYDALFVGGSSDASVIQPEIYLFVESAKQLLAYCLQKSIPVFASCFGFQAAVEALGGKVILDKDNMEMGTYPLWLTEAAATDQLFHDVPNGFWAVSGHKERAVSLPEGAILLAYSDRCPYHAFKMADRPFYSFQFHPELDAKDLSARITRYHDRYLDNRDVLDGILNSLQDTPIANQLIAKFVDRILLA